MRMIRISLEKSALEYGGDLIEIYYVLSCVRCSYSTPWFSTTVFSERAIGDSKSIFRSAKASCALKEF